MKKLYFNCWFAIERTENGWDLLLATPHIEIQKIPLERSNDWHITINLLIGGFVLGWETKKRKKELCEFFNKGGLCRWQRVAYYTGKELKCPCDDFSMQEEK